MLVKKYRDMLSRKSAIRELFDYGRQRAGVIGYENVFDYSIGNPSVPVPERFNRILADLALSGEDLRVHGYSPTLGIDIVRERIAADLQRRFGIPYTKDHIFMTTGAAGAIAHALRAVCDEGSEVVIFAPFFPEYIPYIEGAGCRVKKVRARTQDFQIDFEHFYEVLTPEVSAVLINSPNNPSGTVYSEETLKKLAGILTEKQKEFGHEIYLISDEPYREIMFRGKKCPYTALYYDNTITCYSFSKSLSLPGERIGYVAVNPACEGSELIVPMCGQISRFTGHNCPPSIIQLAVSECLDLTSDMSVYEINAGILYEELTSMGFECVRPDGTFYIFPKVPYGNADEFSRAAREFDILLVSGATFDAPEHIRLSYCIDTEKVERSIPSFRRLMDSYMKGKR